MHIRKIGILTRTYRHANRYRQVLTVLVRHGFGDLVERLHVGEFIEIGMKLFPRVRPGYIERLSRVERVRMALEKLGPTFVKLGQILSTRPDLVSADLIRELSKLQDKVPPFPYQQVEKIIAAELGRPVSAIFSEIDEQPLAAASIGQVHRARLSNGDDVIVKVQRPSVRSSVEIDLEILLHLAMLIEKHVEEIAWYRPTKIVEEFARTIEKEMDYTRELANAERFARLFMADPTIYVPRVYREFSTERVLVMECIDGVKVSRIDELEAKGYDRKLIASRGAEVILDQVFEHGFFHADPHPGNIFILPGNILCFLDFGMMGAIDRNSKEDLGDMLYALVNRDEAKAVKALLKVVESDREPDRPVLEADVANFMELYLYRPLKEIRFEQLLEQLLDLVARHRLRLSFDRFLMLKALAVMEGVGLMLDPDLDMAEKAAPYIRKLMKQRYDPRRVINDFFLSAADFLKLVKIFPGEFQEILKQIKLGQLKFGFEHRGLDRFISEMDRSSNRISVALLISSLIIGSSLIIQVNIGPQFMGLSLLGIIGFLIAALFGLWLIISIVRSGRL
ncbi:MAG: AarF/ABC1/UbiB kinase family protein [Deltaproteobacteria bacterium]|nr:AarF/ABC1/UbiB kinase family protein [Deltaproteobacteria bacterium]